ncbi:MAG: RNA polymerase sigma factor, partial [Acidobacteriota bacterium]
DLVAVSDDEAAEWDPADGGPSAERRLVDRRAWLRTRRAVEALPANQRAVLVLAKFEGLSYREIAETLEITPGAVESRLFRAMRRLESQLAENSA